jgi:hypothetical protein
MKTVTWYIFNVLGKRKHVSPTFLEAGFEWHIEAYPNGIDDTCKGCECMPSPGLLNHESHLPPQIFFNRRVHQCLPGVPHCSRQRVSLAASRLPARATNLTLTGRAVYAVRANLEQLLISLTSSEEDGNGFLSFSPRQADQQQQYSNMEHFISLRLFILAAT